LLILFENFIFFKKDLCRIIMIMPSAYSCNT
jgi:hypothetical protein